MAPAISGTRKRLTGVDALRGAAAVAVLLYHLTLRPAPLVPLGFTGVEVFFCISGFILAYAYEDALDAGMGAFAYAVQRFIRLYPLYLLGLAIGFAVYGLDAALNGADHSAADMAATLVRGLFLIPTFRPFAVGRGVYVEHDPLFPFDNPSWSLLIEVVCSAVFLVWRPRGRALVATLVALGALVVFCALSTLTVGGSTQGTFWLGLPRGLFGFYCGLAIYRLWRADALEALPRSAYAALALLAVGAACKLTLNAYFVVVLIGAPALVALATAEPRSPRARRAFEGFGDLSYPLYLLHAPLLALARLVATRAGWPETEPWPYAAALAAAPAALIAAALAARFYDAPARRWLKARLPDPLSSARPRVAALNTPGLAPATVQEG